MGRPSIPPLIRESGTEETYRSRREFLTEIFSERREFFHSTTGAHIAFVPMEAPSGYVAGFFGRQSTIATHAGPDSDFKDLDLEGWELSVFVLNIESDSQIAWMQHNNRVGSPRPVLTAFFDYHLQRTEFKDWRTFIEYMEFEVDFWDVIKTYKKSISEISFTFLPPNALNAEDEVMKFLRKAKEVNSETLTHTYKSQPGAMKADSDIMKASAKISSDGGGAASIRATLDGKRKLVYSSSKFKETSDLAEHEMPTPKQPGFIKLVITKLFGG